MDPSDMIQNEIYAFSDHGSGLAIVKFDSLAGDTINSFASIRPSAQQYHGPGTWGTTADAGNIRAATNGEENHLNACIAAGTYVP
ncbi:MAG: hypothetical protein Q8941_02700 [Bacteroidota bacterium]|nr:hypothetical protein [Bacteroidota bacterium]